MWKGLCTAVSIFVLWYGVRAWRRRRNINVLQEKLRAVLREKKIIVRVIDDAIDNTM